MGVLCDLEQETRRKAQASVWLSLYLYSNLNQYVQYNTLCIKPERTLTIEGKYN